MSAYWCSRRPQRTYKTWRYPGVPIPHRLRLIYTVDGKRPRCRFLSA